MRGYTLACCCFHLHACFSISHILFPLFLFFFPYVPPLFPWLGAIRSRAAVFDLRVCFSISHISLSLFFFFFPLYASTLPSVRGYTLARCCFSFARVRFPFLGYYSYSSSFSSPYMPPLFPRLGVIRSRTARFHLRACFFHFSYLTLPLLLFLPLYASTLPSVGGYTLARCCVSFARVRFPFLRSYSQSSSFFFALYASTLPSVRGYTLAPSYTLSLSSNRPKACSKLWSDCARSLA